METIKIKYFEKEHEEIKSIKVGDWIDLRASKEVIIKKDEFALVPLGVAMELPKGYEALVAPRSSTFKKWGIIQTNSVGIIDETYCGDDDQWFMPVYCLSPKDFINGEAVTVIHAGDRICQFRILGHQPSIEFDTVVLLGNENRGGHGSTGTN